MSSTYPIVPKSELTVNVDLDVAELVSSEVPVIHHTDKSELFKDSIAIESDGDQVVIKPSYELGTFDTYTIDRNGMVGVKTWGGMRDYGVSAAAQTPLRFGISSILNAAAGSADATLAGKLRAIVEKLDRASECERRYYQGEASSPICPADE
jgi:hypothetical protein